MNSPVIAIDMGNTSVSLALADGARLLRRRRLATRELSRLNVSGALTQLIRGYNPEGSVLCSVVPEMNRLWTRELSAITGHKPMLIHHGLNLGIGIALPHPDEAGADRLANASAVAHWYGTPAIVIDFGTALTFDVVSEDSQYVGGVIAPGLSFLTDYFAERTALLPRITWPQKNRPGRAGKPAAFGRDTEEAMIIGAQTGYLGMVREILTRLRKYFKGRRVRLCATGGHAEWILSRSDMHIPIDPDLTLRGIVRIYELNQ